MMAGLADGARCRAVHRLSRQGRHGPARSWPIPFNGGVVADVRCEGRSLGEIGLNVALAAHSGVPVVLVCGDDTVAAEAALVAPGIHTVVVKRPSAFTRAALLHPDEACDRIEQEAPKALADRGAVRPLRFDGPVLLEVEVLRPHMTERALLIPGIERTDGCTLRYAAPDFPTAYRIAQLIIMLGGI